MRIMRSPSAWVSERTIEAAVIDGWALRIHRVRYLPEGGGAYHWVAFDDDDRRWFLTCDDLTTKPWLGSDADAVFEGLLRGYRTAIDLRTAGLPFVVAPIPNLSGEPAVRIDGRHSLAVLDYVDGVPGRWGRPLGDREHRDHVAMLAHLHGSTAAVRSASRRGLDVPGREGFEHALDDMHHRWDGGPLSEHARRELAEHSDLVLGWLADLDRLAGRLGVTDGDEVITHGEPHPGNVLRTGMGPVLIDWDTVALARPERDLWMIADASSAAVIDAYRDLTGVMLDRDALLAYRLLWALTDLAAFSLQLRGAHQLDADAERALAALRSICNGHEPSPYGAPRDEVVADGPGH
jgi:spectinomycin phosphotransferase